MGKVLESKGPSARMGLNQWPLLSDSQLWNVLCASTCSSQDDLPMSEPTPSSWYTASKQFNSFQASEWHSRFFINLLPVLGSFELESKAWNLYKSIFTLFLYAPWAWTIWSPLFFSLTNKPLGSRPPSVRPPSHTRLADSVWFTHPPLKPQDQLSLNTDWKPGRLTKAVCIGFLILAQLEGIILSLRDE